jgi:shikimate dehydrogenase
VATLSASTRLVGVLGHPVAHSVSPQIHNAAFAAAGVDAVYLAFDVPPVGVETAIGGLAALGALGANVTVPHKQAALAAASRRTPEAEAVGAANTLVFHPDGLVEADNTDATGLAVVLARDVGLERGEPVVLFGAGGAARAAAVALGRAGARVHVDARRPEAAAAVTALAVAHGAVAGGGVEPRVVINATPLGLHGETLPDPYLHLRPGQVALDLVYRPEPTPFLAAAAARGALALDGLGMLVAQAAAAFERWTGLPAPVAVMDTAARAALGR